MRNERRRVPPRDATRRRAYYALRGRATQATSMAQRLYLNRRADALMEWVEVEPSPPPGPKGRTHRA